MKILRIIARLNVGGPARHVVWLTAGLRSPEVESLLIAGTVPPGEDDMGYFAAANEVTPIHIPEMSREISLRDVISVWKIYRLLLRERPDIIHTHTAKAGTVGRIAAIMYQTRNSLFGRPQRCKVVHTYHGHIFHSYYGPLKTRLFLLIEKTLARLGTDRIVVVSEQQRREINETFRVGRKDQFVVVPLGLDLTEFAGWQNRRESFRVELGVVPGDILIGIIGRLTEVKNHELFLKAVRLFKENNEANRHVRFVIVGDGALRQSLQQKVESLGLEKDVTFAGNRRDPENFYPALDIVALTSMNEGTPLTLIEAMANARPVIATGVGGVVDLLGEPATEVVPEGYFICPRGLRVPSGDESAFAAGLARLVRDEHLCREFGERGLQFVEQCYSRERLLKDVSGLYDELLQLAPGSSRVASGKTHAESRI